MPITLSHGGPTIHRSTAPSRQVLLGTIRGVVCLEREAGGPGWHVAHRALTEKHIHALAIEPESGTVFAGVQRGSVFASEDGGRSWERRDDGLTEHDVYSLACAPRTEGPRLYAGTEPARLFSSDDLGHHWREHPTLRSVDMSRWTFPAPPYIAHTKHIELHPDDPDTLFVSIEQGGLLRSTDAGRTFHVVTGMDDDVHRTVVNPLDPEIIHVVTGVGLYVSADGGRTWTQSTGLDHAIGGYPDLLVLHPRRPELLFVAAAEKGPGAWFRERCARSRISKSDDAGRSWRPARLGSAAPLPTAFEAMCLEDCGESFSLFGATATGEVWGSDDGGEHWREIVSGLAPVSKGNHYAAFRAA